jgi:hypothetical protein
MVRVARLALLVLPLSFAFASANGCATYEQELARAEEHFAHDEHEKSLATLRALEGDWTSFGFKERARYCYLRGMTDYRVGFKADARHWLAVAAEIERENPGALAPSEKQTVDEKLGELNQVVWAGDVLPVEEAPGTKPVKKVTTTKAKEDEAEPKKSDEDAPAKPEKKADEDDSPKPKKKKKSDE